MNISWLAADMGEVRERVRVKVRKKRWRFME